MAEEEKKSGVTRLELPGGRVVHLVGTAHVSKESVEEVRRTVEELKPDTVCVELDEQRLNTLKNPRMWETLNLGAAIRQGKGPFLLANLALSVFQRKMGLKTGVKPGAELLEAVNAAEDNGAKVALVDRNIRTTLLRVWRTTGFWKKNMLISTIAVSAFEDVEVDEEALAKLRERDALTAMMEELSEFLPSVKATLIDERDKYMAAKIKGSEGQNIVAVVGAGHIPGISRLIYEDIPDAEVAKLDEIPPKPLISEILPWTIPALIVAVLVAGFFFADPAKLQNALWALILGPGILSALGTIAAFGHPVTVISAFLCAPITVLHPAIGAGMVTGVVQAYVGKPKVKDLENLWEELSHWKGWWKNRVSRIFLVFMFSSWGSAMGAFIAFKWLKDLF
ncbi:TraB/GumN family protein [bacterium]|nr:MAG: TraB/GumN family protein [bacterium]